MNSTCSMRDCAKPFLLSAVLVFVWFVLVGYVAHHHCLMHLYNETAVLWRAPDEMKQVLPFAFFHEAVLAVVLTLLYAKLKKAKLAAVPAKKPTKTAKKDEKEECRVKHGLCFGLLTGLLMGVVAADGYVALPIPLTLAFGWLAMWVVKGLGGGLILSFLFCPKKV